MVDHSEKNNPIVSAALGISKGILIVLYSAASSFSRQSVSASMRDFEGFVDKLDGVDKKQIERSIRYLKSKKLISIQGDYDTKSIKLTKVGWLRAKKLSRSFAIDRPEKWDKKWRIVIFDIPINKRAAADSFRNNLKLLGFANLQKSIWVYPYECKDQIYFLAEKMGIQSSVRYVVADYITGQRDLKHLFSI